MSTAEGKSLLTLWRWSMFPNAADRGTTAIDAKRDAGYHVTATFDSPAGEHYYGLGQQQQGDLDLRDHRIRCWHDYSAIGGENVCVPFMISSHGYGLVWDNPSKTTIDLGFNQQNVWSSEVGERVSFFVIAGNTSDEIYEGYRQLTGAAPLLPKASYGYIQSKAIYPTQEQLLSIARFNLTRLNNILAARLLALIIISLPRARSAHPLNGYSQCNLVLSACAAYSK